MDSFEALVAHIQGFSSNFNDLSHLHSFLKQSKNSLRFQANRLAPVLDQLDPLKHTLGYLFIFNTDSYHQLQYSLTLQQKLQPQQLPQQVEVDGGGKEEEELHDYSLIQKMEVFEAMDQVTDDPIVRKMAPEWLPWYLGSSYWVPPHETIYITF
ncbi:hypothetical protein GIB67_027306 [Kingdonia uniflora]|uniref:Uncharacterized protein n=1 Tax=Kingdonia uniflora TaxID=39325 RepID=A0A7J7KYP9_9MAGN|nr:hypothetical protein GIB67_027306 [Kingdonia uniflora]